MQSAPDAVDDVFDSRDDEERYAKSLALNGLSGTPATPVEQQPLALQRKILASSGLLRHLTAGGSDICRRDV